MEQRVCVGRPKEVKGLHVGVTDSKDQTEDYLQNQVP